MTQLEYEQTKKFLEALGVRVYTGNEKKDSLLDTFYDLFGTPFKKENK
jgi:hypothetical protein